MLNQKTLAVVVPAYNEESQISMVIETMPEFVDRIIIVNDASPDATLEVVKKFIENDAKDYSNKKIGPVSIERTVYNEADVFLEELDKKEMAMYIPSEVINENPERNRIILINHLKNGGVGSAIARGYKWCNDNNIDCTAVMAGDGQMDPGELEGICKPVIEEGIDYVKGNRLIHRSARYLIPK